MRNMSLVLAAVIALTASFAFAQSKKHEDQTRSLQGIVTTDDGAPAPGAVVYLKNLKNLQVRSFITQEKGEYVFHGVSTDVDYEVKAVFNGASSATKGLSSFDSKKDAVINLKLEKK